MKSFKKNQIVIFVIAIMLVAAGYLNYTAIHPENDTVTANTNSLQYAGIGDAKLVGSNSVETGNQIHANVEVGSLVENGNTVSSGISTDKDSSNEQENTVTTSGNQTADPYFSSSRLERDTMYSQMLESYQKILENTAIGTDQKGIAQTEIKNINDQKNSIMITENLIKTKGFEDVIIFINDKSVSVIVKAENLASEQIAQIQNIVTRELNVDINNVHISNK